MTIAIDFGTSNTVITRWNAATEQPEPVSLPQLSYVMADNPPLVPSLVYVQQVDPPQVLIGEAVRSQGLNITNDARFFRNMKRGIGTAVQGFRPEIDGQSIRFEQVGEWFIQEMLHQLKLLEPDLDSLIFTVPVDSFEAYRHWLGQVCEASDISQVRMIDEPTAAALGYGLRGNQTLLVLDMGGGTLDLSLVRLETPPDQKPLGFILKWGSRSLAEESGQRVETARVFAKGGENLGGADIDNWLADYFYQHQGLNPTALTLQLVERLKIRLSTDLQAQEVYFNDETLETIDLSLSRDQFNQILTENHFFDRLEQQLGHVLQQGRRQGIEADDIDAIILVGGTAQIPALQDWVKATFGEERVRSDRPFTAIAEGALQLQQGITLKDFLYHSYGIRYWDRRNNCHGWHSIIKQGQPYPMGAPVELTLGASVDKQPSIELVLGELGNETAQMEVYFEGDRLVTRPVSQGTTAVQPLNDSEAGRTIARLSPPGYPGSDRIKVQFWVDRDRLLRITVEDILAGETLLTNQPVVQLR
jgi:molecular chaperone DnaK (HSP70)